MAPDRRALIPNATILFIKTLTNAENRLLLSSSSTLYRYYSLHVLNIFAELFQKYLTKVIKSPNNDTYVALKVRLHLIISDIISDTFLP